jgi:tetratricopeptide (TPR) repeat protein
MRKTSTQKALEIAKQHHLAGRLAEAEKKCRVILRENPDDPGALGLASALARQQGRIAEALEIATHAAKTHPQIAELHTALGKCCLAAGKRDEAVSAFERAVELKPLEPAYHDNLAAALFQTRQYERALEACERAVQIKADYTEAWSNMGGVLRELGRLEEAAAAVDKALRLQPRWEPTYINMALIRAGQERFDEAMECTLRALAIRPDYAEAHYNLGMLHLLAGDMERGWPEYQWRTTRKPPTARPVWRGEDLRDKTILLSTEQGSGDTIQFVRYVPMLQERGARVWLVCRAPLARLLEQIVPVVRPGEGMPPHDFWCPLLSLPMLFGTRVQNIPARIPYLKAQSATGKSPTFRVGLAWAGSPTHRDDIRRSVRFEQFMPILSVPEIEFVSLQVGPAAKQADGSKIARPGIELRDFADTAAVIEGLDLVISVDTAVAHLAGAMGKPVWVLLAKVPEWRWMLGRSDSPWYPTMRLFRQQRSGDWEGPIGEAAKELRDGI